MKDRTSPAQRHPPAKRDIPMPIRIPVLVAIICVSPTLTFGDVVNSAVEEELAAGGQDLVVLSAGDQTEILEDQGAVRIQQQALSAAEIQRCLQWREGRLVFTGQPLAEVVAEFNRYNTGQMVIMDQTIAGLSITGPFAAKDLKGFLSFLTVRHGITATFRNPGGKEPEVITFASAAAGKRFTPALLKK